MKKKKKIKNRDGNIAGGNFLGGDFLMENLPGGV